MICTTHPYIFVVGQQLPILTVTSLYYTINITPPAWYVNCLSCHNVTTLNLTYVLPLRWQAQIWLLVNLTRHWQDSFAIYATRRAFGKFPAPWFLLTLIAFLILASVIIASATAVSVSLEASIHTAKVVNEMMTNVTKEMIPQIAIDKGILTRLQTSKRWRRQ